jgi:hypothetical protein
VPIAILEEGEGASVGLAVDGDDVEVDLVETTAVGELVI